MKGRKNKHLDSEIESDLAHFTCQYSELLLFYLSSSLWETSVGMNERNPVLDPDKLVASFGLSSRIIHDLWNSFGWAGRVCTCTFQCIMIKDFEYFVSYNRVQAYEITGICIIRAYKTMETYVFS